MLWVRFWGPYKTARRTHPNVGPLRIHTSWDHGWAVPSLLDATPPPSRSGPKAPRGGRGGGALEGGVQGGAMGGGVQGGAMGGGGREGRLGGGSRWGNLG